MANRAGIRAEPLVGSAAGTTRGLEASSSSTGALDTTALAFEHVLASLARIEARLDASERRNSVAPPPPRPDPKPPYSDWERERPEPPRHTSLITAVTAVATQQQVGFGDHAYRGQRRSTLAETQPWERFGHSGVGNRGRQPTAWDNPDHRHEIHAGRQSTAWDSPWARHDGGGYSEPPRYDHYRSDRSRYEEMKPPCFDGSDAVNWISRVPVVVGGDPPNRVVSDDERSDPGGYRRIGFLGDKIGECDKKGVFEDFEERPVPKERGMEVVSDEEDDEDKMWEEEQVRKGLGKRLDDGVGIQGAGATVDGLSRLPPSGMHHPTQNARTMVSLAKTDENLSSSLLNVTSLEDSLSAAGEKFLFMQKLREFVSVICAFLQVRIAFSLVMVVNSLICEYAMLFSTLLFVTLSWRCNSGLIMVIVEIQNRFP